MTEDVFLKEKYWKVVCRTRASCRISSSLKTKIEEKWEKYDDDVVEEALKIHINRYAGYKENYTLGIMKNLQKMKDERKSIKKNSFQPEEKKDYDFEKMEDWLLSN